LPSLPLPAVVVAIIITVKPIILFDNVFFIGHLPKTITKVRDATETYSAWRQVPLIFTMARVQDYYGGNSDCNDEAELFQIKSLSLLKGEMNLTNRPQDWGNRRMRQTVFDEEGVGIEQQWERECRQMAAATTSKGQQVVVATTIGTEMGMRKSKRQRCSDGNKRQTISGWRQTKG
jgi:hypothetical protein